MMKNITVLGIILSLGAGILFATVASWPLRQKNMKLSVVLIFLAVLIGQFNFGIVGSIIIAAFLLAYFSWLNFIHNPKTGQKKILFILTAIVAHLYLILHLINLPIRIHLNQTDFRIAINISTIFLGMTMVMGCIEKWSQKTESRNEEDDLNSLETQRKE